MANVPEPIDCAGKCVAIVCFMLVKWSTEVKVWDWSKLRNATVGSTSKKAWNREIRADVMVVLLLILMRTGWVGFSINPVCLKAGFGAGGLGRGGGGL